MIDFCFKERKIFRLLFPISLNSPTYTRILKYKNKQYKTCKYFLRTPYLSDTHSLQPNTAKSMLSRGHCILNSNKIRANEIVIILFMSWCLKLKRRMGKIRLCLHFVAFLPDLTTFDDLFHLFYCIYGGIFQCKSQ